MLNFAANLHRKYLKMPFPAAKWGVYYYIWMRLIN